MMANRRFVLVTLLALLVAGLSPQVFAQQDEQQSYLFQVVLLVGDNEGETELDRVPGNVLVALEDVRQFISYSKYHFVDSAVMRSNATVEARMSGPSNQPMTVEFHFVQESLKDSQKQRLFVRQFGLGVLDLKPRDQVSTDKQGKTSVVHVPPAEEWREVLRSSFSLDVGETIVVGSSKLNGSDQALIILFTAVR
jgi:hypothetical protein